MLEYKRMLYRNGALAMCSILGVWRRGLIACGLLALLLIKLQLSHLSLSS